LICRTLAQHVITMWKYRGLRFWRGSIPHSSVCFYVTNINTIKSYQPGKNWLSCYSWFTVTGLFHPACLQNMGSQHQGHDVIRKKIIDFQCLLFHMSEDNFTGSRNMWTW